MSESEYSKISIDNYSFSFISEGYLFPILGVKDNAILVNFMNMIIVIEVNDDNLTIYETLDIYKNPVENSPQIFKMELAEWYYVYMDINGVVSNSYTIASKSNYSDKFENGYIEILIDEISYKFENVDNLFTFFKEHKDVQPFTVKECTYNNDYANAAIYYSEDGYVIDFGNHYTIVDLEGKINNVFEYDLTNYTKVTITNDFDNYSINVKGENSYEYKFYNGIYVGNYNGYAFITKNIDNSYTITDISQNQSFTFTSMGKNQFGEILINSNDDSLEIYSNVLDTILVNKNGQTVIYNEYIFSSVYPSTKTYQATAGDLSYIFKDFYRLKDWTFSNNITVPVTINECIVNYEYDAEYEYSGLYVSNDNFSEYIYAVNSTLAYAKTDDYCGVFIGDVTSFLNDKLVNYSKTSLSNEFANKILIYKEFNLELMFDETGKSIYGEYESYSNQYAVVKSTD